MSNRKRKQQVREMAARARARQIEERRPYSEIYELLKNGTDEELVARIDRAVAEGSDIMHHLDKYRYALIHTAALENRPAAFVPLLRAGFTVDGRELDGKGTPLHIAANCGSAEAARELIRLGADVNAIGFDDKAPLHCAACYTKETDEKKFEARQLVRHEASPAPLFNPHRRRKRQPPAAVRLHARLQRPTRPGDSRHISVVWEK